MPYRNRVNPFSQIEIHSARGLFTGNRGIIHRDGEIVHPYGKTTLWLVCLLEFNNRKRPIMENGQWMPLFFLDEVTAFAAGHRTCAECRRADYRRFKAAWMAAFGENPDAMTINRRLHGERMPIIRGDRPLVRPADLPDGAMFTLGGLAYAKSHDAALLWDHAGYGAPMPLPDQAELLTCPTLVEIFRAGYEPVWHPSANR
ncbi:MAG: hypothetical protein SFX74_02395 [Fimbriimonadaceae bacterium]|nr:hypothetical protein [Fimbriimonadaceae bacterium]